MLSTRWKNTDDDNNHKAIANYQEDDLGPIYGFQWRHFNAPYKDCNTDYNNTGYDQLQDVINKLKDPEKRKP